MSASLHPGSLFANRFEVVRETVAKMVETGSRPGVVVNMSSIARHGNRGQSNYSAAKAALAANTVTWSRQRAMPISRPQPNATAKVTRTTGGGNYGGGSGGAGGQNTGWSSNAPSDRSGGGNDPWAKAQNDEPPF